jgi:hypothetical protein
MMTIRKRREETANRRTGPLLFMLALFVLLPGGCAMDPTDPGANGKGTETPGGDGMVSHTTAAGIARTIDSWSGVWHSRYAGRKLDGYRIGKWKDRHSLLPREKMEQLFPGFDLDAPRFLNYSGYAYDAAVDFPPGKEHPAGLEDAYFVFYDDTAFESEIGDGGNGGWGNRRVRYLGIVKAVNTFNDSDGAVIIQYLEGCFPSWDADFIGPPPHCYFGLYYRVQDPDTIQMANAVALANLYNGKKYYTETATLEEAIAKNNPENEGKFISWDVAITQRREKEE